MAQGEAENRASSRRLLRLLLVEDNLADAELSVAVLKHSGYSVSFELADSPALLGQRLEQGEYDLILCDHNLGGWLGTDALEILRKSGKDIPFVVVTATLGDEAAVEYIKNGATEYVLKHRLQALSVAVGRALREKAHREEAARLQEEILCAKKDWELTFDTVPDPVLLLNEECLITRANRATTKALGLDFSELIGRPCYEVFHETRRPQPDDPHGRLLETFCHEWSDREVLRLGRVFDVTCAPLRDVRGAVRRCILVMHDVTERKRGEKALRESEERYRQLFEKHPHPLWVYDLETLRFLAVNEAAVRHYGYSREQFLSMTLKDIRRKDDIPALLESAESHRSKKDPVELDVSRHRKADGTILLAEVTAYGLIFDGRPAKLVVANDVTERQEMEEQLRRAQKMEAVGRLAGGVAHDFNNLLNVIIGYSALLGERLPAEDPLRKHAEEIKKAGQRAAALTRQLLAFSRRQVLQPRVLDLNAVIAETESVLRRLVGEDMELVTVSGPGLGRVLADTAMIEQILVSLALNARDVMPKGGKLTIETRNVILDEDYARRHPPAQAGPYVMLAMSDTGPGMDADTLAHVFEPFFTTKGRGKATGLGLATVYGIVKQSHGFVWVYSEPREGTTFKIYLPLAEAGEQGEAAEPGKAAATSLRGTETVLLVEDEEALRKLAGQFLTAQGYRVLEAGHGAEALEAAEKLAGTIHLLVTDVVMPGMSGREVAERLAARRPSLKVLYVSGYPDNAIVHHGVLEPGQAFLQKPFSPMDLVRKVRQVLNAPRAQPAAAVRP